MSTSIVDRIYVQSTDAFYELQPPVDVLDLGRRHNKVSGTIGEVLGSACIQHILEADIDVTAIYGESLRHFSDRFDAELAATDPDDVDALLADSFGQQGISITRCASHDQVAEAQVEQSRRLELFPGIVGLAA